MFPWQSPWIYLLCRQEDYFVAARFIMNKVYSAPRKDVRIRETTLRENIRNPQENHK